MMNKMTKPTPSVRQFSERGTDWDYLATVTDTEIERAVAEDPDAAPILSDEQMRREFKPHPPRIRK